MDIEIISAIISSVSIIVGSMIIPTINILYQKHKNKVKNKNISIFQCKLEEVKKSVENIVDGARTKDVREMVDKSMELETLYKDLSRNGCQEYKKTLVFGLITGTVLLIFLTDIMILLVFQKMIIVMSIMRC
jgi:hypothetical protein